ncbi:hypothetical protein PHYPSEUDO_009675 [Phytophthora pseudosyringae]|uniref:Elicitin-like protein n=1 Tax=Phytophthora pseudosyringae TaxID=221518 RepID=A0A8T1W8T8_9STRA|nr:hypothetical protein PHYPSEUDO_009675 [Phytophthora pseudosyringae]
MRIQLLAALVATAMAVGDAVACDGFDQLRFTLNTNEGGVADALRECVAPVLFAPAQWLPGDQVHEFCAQEACKRAVQRLKTLPSFIWESKVPSGSDANTLVIAQQVMRDCGGTV